jgi:hypothetical protein
MAHDPTLLRAYGDLRALVEDLIDARSPAERRRVTGALATWLRAHCAQCGTPLERDRRGRGEPWCWGYEITSLPPPRLPALPDDTDVPF